MLVSSVDELVGAVRSGLDRFVTSMASQPKCGDCNKEQAVLPTTFQFRTPDGKAIAYDVTKYEMVSPGWCQKNETPDLKDEKGNVRMQEITEETDGKRVTKKVAMKGAQITMFFCPDCSGKRGLVAAQQPKDQQV